MRHDENWPVHTAPTRCPPAKFVFADEGTHSVLSPGVRVNSFCEIENSILLPNVTGGRRSRIRGAVICQGVQLPGESIIGFDPEVDRSAGHVIAESGVVVVDGAPHRVIQSCGELKFTVRTMTANVFW